MGMLIGSLIGIQVGALVTKVVKGTHILGFYAVSIIAGFINRASTLPKKMVELEYINMSTSVVSGIEFVGNIIFWIVVSIFGIWVISKFITNIGKLRGRNSHGKDKQNIINDRSSSRCIVLRRAPSHLLSIFGDGRNGLTYADEMFNTLSKGSSYFIPELQKNSENFKGQTLSVRISAAKPDDKPGDTEKRIENISKVLTTAGAKIEVTGTDMKIEGDLGAILVSALQDSDAMYKNQGDAIKARYGADDEKKIFRQWYNAFTSMDKALKKDGKVEQAKSSPM